MNRFLLLGLGLLPLRLCYLLRGVVVVGTFLLTNRTVHGQRKEKREEKEERWQNEKDEKEGWVWEGDKENGDWVWKDQEDELANQFNATMNISTKRRRIDDV